METKTISRYACECGSEEFIVAEDYATGGTVDEDGRLNLHSDAESTIAFITCKECEKEKNPADFKFIG